MVVLVKRKYVFLRFHVLISELLRSGDISEVGKDTHGKCREEYDQLKEEFERYKLRAQSVLKNKSSSKVSIRKGFCPIFSICRGRG